MKIGMITFHRVYNYGAVLQAYCLQKHLKNHGYDCGLIDYASRQQRDYCGIVSLRNGPKRFVKTIMLVPKLAQRLARKKKFDRFLSERISLSDKTYDDVGEMAELNDKYDAFLVGSDQVWNVAKTSEVTDVYFLSFVKDGKKRASYASSIGVATKEQLKPYCSYLNKFDCLSCREENGTAILSDLLDKKVQTVLDPTLLVDREILTSLSSGKQMEKKKYIFYYSIYGFDKRKQNMDVLLELKKRFGLDIVFLTPEWPFHGKLGTDVIDAGPSEFIDLLLNATLVCTTSFHGTALAIRFNIPFYVLEGKSIPDQRKRNILKQLGIEDRIITGVKDIKDASYEMDYSQINVRLELLQKVSSDYLDQAMNVLES